MKTCKKCGTEYQDDFNNCPNCGSSKIITEKDVKGTGEEIKENILKKRKRQQLILVSLGIVAVIAVIAIIAGVSSAINEPRDEYSGLTTREFNTENKELLEEGKDEIKEEDYEDAIEVLNEIDSQYKNYEQAQSLLSEATSAYIDNIISKVDNYIGKEEYEKALDVIAESKLVVDRSDDIDDAMNRILDEFRADYISQAEELEASGDYEGAIRLLENTNEVFNDDMVIENKIIDLTNMYKTKFLDDAAIYLNDNNYSEAINVLESAQLVFGEEEDIDLALVNAHIFRVKDEVKTYEDSQDYAGGITYLEKQLDDVGNNAEIVQKLNSFKNIYKSELISIAETEFNVNGYKSAISILEEGEIVLGKDLEITELITEYKEYEPVFITSLESIAMELPYSCEFSQNKYYEDKFSNKYRTSFQLDGGHVSYFIGQKYTYFSGTIACPREIEYWDARDYAQVKVYGDDNLIFTSEQMWIDSKPEEFKVDIANVDVIKIEWICEGYNIWEDWGYYATIFNGELYK